MGWNHQPVIVARKMGGKWCSHDPQLWWPSNPCSWDLRKFHPLEVGGFLNFWEWHLCRARVRTKMSEFLVFKPGMIAKGLSRGVYASIRGCVNTHLNYILYFIYNDDILYIYTYVRFPCVFRGLTSLTNIPITIRIPYLGVGWDLLSSILLINLGTSPDDNDHFLEQVKKYPLEGTITLSHLGKRKIID